MAVREECAAWRRLSAAETDTETRKWEKVSSDMALYETNRELESQRLELYQAHQWADHVNRCTSHTAHFNMYRCAQSVRTSHMMLHAHAWLKFKLCLPQKVIPSLAQCLTPSTEHAALLIFSSVPGLQRLLTSRNPCADSREHGG